MRIDCSQNRGHRAESLPPQLRRSAARAVPLCTAPLNVLGSLLYHCEVKANVMILTGQNKNWKQHKPWCGVNPMREAYHQTVIKGYEAACPDSEEELDKVRSTLLHHLLAVLTRFLSRSSRFGPGLASLARKANDLAPQDNSPMGPAVLLQPESKAPALPTPTPSGSTPLETSLTTFLDHLQPEIGAALYSSLSLLSPYPRNKSHALVLLLSFDPTASDPSTAFSITEARVEPLADVDRAIDGLSKDGSKPAIGGRGKPLEKYLRDLKPPPSALVAALFCLAVVQGSKVTAGVVRPLSLEVGWMPDAAAKIQVDGEWEEWFLERAKLSATEKVEGTGISKREMARLMTVRFLSREWRAGR